MYSQRKIEKIVITMAMRQEAQPIIEALKLSRLDAVFDPELPLEAYQSVKKGLTVILVLSGKDEAYNVDNVATQPAVIAALLAIQTFGPDLIINAGTAGGIGEKGARIGNVFVSSDAIKFHDRRISIPGFREYGIGSYPCLNVSRMAADLKLNPGVISTGNSLDMTTEDKENIKSNNAAVKDMEAAAVAWIAKLYHTPMFALKSITDLIDSDRPTEEDFLQNLKLASENLRIKVLKVVDYCLGKTLAELGKH